MAQNQLTQLDKNLKDCFQYDLNWELLPNKLREGSSLYNNLTLKMTFIEIDIKSFFFLDF